jgi:hypothetical protein
VAIEWRKRKRRKRSGWAWESEIKGFLVVACLACLVRALCAVARYSTTHSSITMRGENVHPHTVVLLYVPTPIYTSNLKCCNLHVMYACTVLWVHPYTKCYVYMYENINQNNLYKEIIKCSK